jgi:dipeptidyl aminopeptidase/acylaminoacyl peptidase
MDIRSTTAVVMTAISLMAANAGVADDVELYAQQPIMTGASLSPDGTQVAFLSSMQGRYHVVIERFKPTFSRYVLYPGEELEFEWVKWANDDRLVLSSSYSARRDLAFRSSRLWVVDTTETRLFSVGPEGQNLISIIEPAKERSSGSRIARELPPPQIQDEVIDWLPGEPNHILVSVDSDFDGGDEVRKVDVRDGSYKNLVNDGSNFMTWVSDGAGKVRLGWVVDEDDNLSVVARNQDDGWHSARDFAFVKAGYRPLVFTKDPQVVLTYGLNAAGRKAIRSADARTGEFIETVFEHERFDVESVRTDDSTGLPVGSTFTEHRGHIIYFDETMKKLQRNIDSALPDRSNIIESTSSNHRQILILSHSDTGAGSYYLWDRDEGSLSFYENQYSDLGDGMIAPVEAVSYKARDGLEIPAYLTIASGVDREKLPTVVLPHGGPADRDDASYWFLSQFLASRGYAVLQPNFRGSAGYGQEFRLAGRGEWGGKMQDDVSDGANWLVDQGIADPERMCIVGWSYGGYAAAMAAVKTPDLFQCAASINGVLDLPRLITDDKLKYAFAREWTKHMGLSGESSRAVSPYDQTDSIKIPMLIVQSLDDTRIESEQGSTMAKRLQSEGKSVDYLEIEFGGHSIENVDGRKKLLKALGDFVDENIGSTAR